MKLNDLEARLPALYYSALEDGGPSYMVTSAPGRGKTSVFKTFKRSMKKVDPNGKYGFSIINGANFTLMTAMGFMVWSDDAQGRPVSKFSLPYWYYDHEDGLPLDAYDGGIIFIDEADKLGADEKKIVGEAALSKVLGNHKFPPGWVAMFAGNRVADKSGSTRDFFHLRDRRIDLAVTDDVEAWKLWAEGHNVLPETIQFGEENPQLLFEPMADDDRKTCTPRSLHQIDIHLRSLMSSFGTDTIPTDPLTIEEIKGGIGAVACAGLIKTIRLGQELISFEEAVANPTTAKVPMKPDAQRLLSYKLAARVSKETAPQVMTYMSRLPSEHHTMFVRMSVQRNYQIAFEPTFAAWCSKNAALISILNRYKVETK
jgi:hypothetical protein